METCLVVDDSSVVRTIAARILLNPTTAVETAATGAEGLALFAERRCGVVLLSSTLPDMPADEFVRRLRATPGGGAATILPMLVEANLGTMTRLKRAGATGFAFKPFNRAALSGWLDPYLSSPDSHAA